MDVAVNAVTNKIYFTSAHGTVTVMDGETNGIQSIPVGGDPTAVAVNEATNRI